MKDTEVLIVEVENKAKGDLILDQIETQEKRQKFSVVDAAMAYSNANGDVKLRQTKDMTAGAGAGWGAGAGLVAGLVIGGPVAAILLGAAAGAVAAGIGDNGVSRELMKRLRSHVSHGHSLVFVQVERSQADAFADFAFAQSWRIDRQTVLEADHAAIVAAAARATVNSCPGCGAR